MFVIIRKVTWLICYSKRARISRTGASKNCIELMRNKSISGLKFSRVSLSETDAVINGGNVEVLSSSGVKGMPFPQAWATFGGVLQAGHE